MSRPAIGLLLSQGQVSEVRRAILADTGYQRLCVLGELGISIHPGVWSSRLTSSYPISALTLVSFRLIRDGAAIPFTAFARSPTVTMPRLKAITTGSIPSFLDAILNIDEGDTTSSLATQDTWLAQMKAKDSGVLVMFGDDTWLKLFPDTFSRHDGTSSFFVSVRLSTLPPAGPCKSMLRLTAWQDFTEVDHNVTRNIAGELENEDWNTLILHYLGLDHIGHKSGPRR